MTVPKSVVILSGGMDSTTLAYQLKRNGHELHTLSFDYGQRHRKELDYAAFTSGKLGALHHRVDLSTLIGLLGGSSLTSPDIDVPEGHYTSESMAATVVPNRNQIMLSIALGYGHSIGADFVATAVHAGDHEIYWDCRPDFIKAMDNIAQQAITAGYGNAHIIAPYVGMTKAQICYYGQQLYVPWNDTWSCYKGGNKHCGRCGTCIERHEAFLANGLDDPTEYDDLSLYDEYARQGRVVSPGVH